MSEIHSLIKGMVRLESLMRNPLALVRAWPDGRVQFIYVSERFARWHGATREDILEDTAAALKAFHPEDRPGFVEAVRICLEKDAACRRQFRLSLDGAADRWVELLATIECREPEGSAVWRIILTDVTERKFLELSVEEEASLKHHFLNQSMDGVVILESSSCSVIEANPAFAAMLGHDDPDELRGRHAWDWDLNYSKDEILAMACEHMDGRRMFETRMRRKDGGVIDAEVSSTPIGYREKKYFFCICRDVTGRKALEQAARTEAAWHEAVFKNSPDAMVVLDRDMALVRGNPAWEKLLGYSMEEMRGFHAWDWDAKHTREELEAFGKADQFGYFPPIQTIHRRKDGSLVPVEIHTSPLPFTGKELGLCMVRDISERKALEEAARTEAAWHRIIFDESPDAMVVLDRDMALVRANPAWAELLGYSLEEMRGFHAWDWDAQFSREELETFGKANEFGGVPSFETIHRRKDGSLVHVEIHTTPLSLTERKLGLCVVRDVTHRKALEEARRTEAAWHEAVFNNSPDAMVVLDRDMALVRANPAWEKLLGYSMEEMQGFHAWDWDALFSREGLEQLGRDPDFGRSPPFESVFRRKNGTTLNVEIHSARVSITGRDLGLYTIRDVTERRRMELSRREQQELHAAMIHQAPLGVVLVDSDSLLCFEFNDVACGMLGYTREEFARLTLFDINGQWPREEFSRHIDELIVTGQDTFETLHRAKDGSLVDTQVSARLVMINGQHCFLAFWTDVTEVKRAERELRAREREVRTLVDNTQDCIIRYDRNLVRSFVNAAAGRILGGSREEIVGRSVRTGPAHDMDLYVATVENVFDTGKPAELEFTYRSREGRTAWMLMRFSPEPGPDGAVESVVAVGRDITEMVRQREELHHLAFHDSLTGLPNRVLFQERLRREAADHRRRGEQFAVILLDLDHFKDVNDTLGHADGDRMIRQVARRLAGCLSPGDTLARLGGDEFAVLLSGVRSPEDAGTVAGRLLEKLDEPVILSDREVHTSASLGIAVYPGDTRKIKELLSFADMAMYHAKAKGRGNFQYHDPRLTEAAEMRVTLGSQLRHALERGELELYYQPKVSMPDGQVRGAEALIRWNHPELGLLTPDKFIPMAEETGLIMEIGGWVIEEACRAVAGWNDGLENPFHVAVNLSGRQFVKSDLPAVVQAALQSSGCTGSRLELELTETIMLEDNPAIQKTLESLRNLGVTIAIDDFGTGHSALSYLNRFQVDVLKIDRSFVRDVEKDQRKAGLVRAFIAVAKAMDMGLVAEGVELPEQADFLCENGCTVGQGWLYGKPMPLDVFRKHLGDKLFKCRRCRTGPDCP